MWELDCEENWAPKNWCFWTVMLEKTLENPLDCKKFQSDQSWCSLEGLILKLKLQYFGHLMQRTDSFEKTLMLGKTEVGGEGDDRGWDGWMASRTQWTWVWVSSRSWWWTGRPSVLQSMGSQSWTQLSDWNELNKMWRREEKILCSGQDISDAKNSTQWVHRKNIQDNHQQAISIKKNEFHWKCLLGIKSSSYGTS